MMRPEQHMDGEVHLAIIADGAGMQGAAMVIKAALLKTPSAVIHVVDMGMARADIDRLAALSPCVRMVAVPEDSAAWLANFALHGDSHVSRAAYAKLQLHRLLPDVDKVLYLDTDTLPLCDLSELYALDLGDQLAGATWTEFQVRVGRFRLGLSGRYFNSGVMLCGLHRWRECRIEDAFLDWYRANHGKMKFNDQEILNGVFDGRNIEIGKRWNVSHWEVYKGRNETGVGLGEIGILHFNGHLKPWLADYEQKMMPDPTFAPIRSMLDRLGVTPPLPSLPTSR